MLQNASSLAIVAVDTEENEPIKNEVWWVRRHFLGPRLLQEMERFDEAHALRAGQTVRLRLEGEAGDAAVVAEHVDAAVVDAPSTSRSSSTLKSGI